MSDYNPHNFEQKWQDKWEETNLYRSEVDWDKPKHYAVTMLPYPSGDLHIGHWFAMTPSDARARFMRMKGFNVLFPMGYDAFGLPAEQAAISRNIHPWKWTYANIERMRKQMKNMGTMFDWEREAITSTPNYYKWDQWFFEKFYENDLAYRGEAMVNWSEALQTVLANEQVIDGRDERLGQPVVQKLMTQWFFRYKAYTDEMLDFEAIDWPEPIKAMQKNWIGRSEGAKVTFKVDGHEDETITVFTTRPDTLWGATFMVLAPEHPLVETITTTEQSEKIKAYQEETAKFTEVERLTDDGEKTGVATGAYAINPVNGKKIPIWIADYVMVSYGTGAIMAVPYGDQRDFEFARKFGLDIVAVVKPDDADEVPNPAEMDVAYAGSGTMVNSGVIDGVVHNGGKGRQSPAISAAIDYLEEQGVGEENVNYRLRDWLISRQRYWGIPIPMIHREDGTLEAVPMDQLPVELPEDVDFEPTGRSPLTYHAPFYETVDSEGNPAKRETDTMDTFMSSSWYHLRYLSPNLDTAPFDAEEAAYWLPVDTYTGGAEHATMHLLYARWFNKALRDLGVFDEAMTIAEQHGRNIDGMLDEPYMQLRNQGQVLGAERSGDYLVAFGQMDGDKLVADHVEVVTGGEKPNIPMGVAVAEGELMKRVESNLWLGESMQLVEVPAHGTVEIPTIEGTNNVNQLKHHLEIQRMSKSKGNVVNPDELVTKYGSDTVRAYLMFGFDWEQGGPWNESQIIGPVRWLSDVWDIVTTGVSGDKVNEKAERDIERKAHQIIAKIEQNMENFKFNVVVAGLMELRNSLKDAIKQGISQERFEEIVNIMLRLMAPITPHIAEELWAHMGWEYSVHTQAFPEYDAEKAKEDEMALVVMINGKPRENIMVSPDIAEDDAKALAMATSAVKDALNGNEARRVIFIPGRGREPKVNVVV
ncbi:MAG: leucine--tRNA ligase [Phototrophicaceae bacterium]